MKYTKILIIFVLLCSLTSCRYLIFKLLAEDKSAVANHQIFESEDKQVVYLPMVHVGKGDYFPEVKRFVDSMRNKGYHVFYEGIYLREDISEEDYNIYIRKFRREIGHAPTDSYADPDNKSLPRWLKKYEGQSIENTGINPETDTNIDYELTALIDKYEQDYKEIELTDCDFETPLLEKYKCSKGVNFLLSNVLRDEKVVNEIVESEHNKILLLFGKGHQYHIHPKLMKKGFNHIHDESGKTTIRNNYMSFMHHFNINAQNKENLGEDLDFYMGAYIDFETDKILNTWYSEDFLKKHGIKKGEIYFFLKNEFEDAFSSLNIKISNPTYQSFFDCNSQVDIENSLSNSCCLDKCTIAFHKEESKMSKSELYAYRRCKVNCWFEVIEKFINYGIETGKLGTN